MTGAEPPLALASRQDAAGFLGFALIARPSTSRPLQPCRHRRYDRFLPFAMRPRPPATPMELATIGKAAGPVCSHSSGVSAAEEPGGRGCARASRSASTCVRPAQAP